MHRALRLLLFALMLAAIGLGGYWWSVKVRPVYRVAGGSMAPTLLGPHFQLTCRQCKIELHLDATQPLDDEVTCGHCGYQRNDAREAVRRPGQTLTISPEHGPNWWPQWGDLVLFEAEGQTSVKRVAGMPGGQVAIAEGDLWINGRRMTKTLEQMQASQILVFDQNHDPEGQSRFRPARQPSGWEAVPGWLTYRRKADQGADRPTEDGGEEGADQPSELPDRLYYHHLACLPPPHRPEQASVPMDQYLYNHRLSRRLFPVSDIWIELSIYRLDQGTLTVTLHGQDQEIRQVFEGKDRRPVHILLGHCDGQLHYQVREGNGTFSRTWQPEKPFRPTDRPFSLTIEGATFAELGEVRIYRDIHYLAPGGQEETWSFPHPVPEGNVLLLGDNVPISQDSRHHAAGVPITALRGLVKGRGD